MSSLIILTALGGLVLGGGAGYLGKQYLAKKSKEDLEAKQKNIILEAKDEALKIKEKAKKDEEEKQKYLQELENNLRRKEELIDRRTESIDLERKNIETRGKETEEVRAKLKELEQQEMEILEKIAKMNKDGAKELLLEMTEKEFKTELVRQIKTQKEASREEAESYAKEMIATAIGRIASEQTAESTVSPIALPSEEMKGRIIGKEGRNIQAFEKATGVDVVIDDTPDTVILSSFDPVRRHVAKLALETLIADGRIHPTKIEESVEKAKNEINKQIKEAGEQAIFEVGVAGLHQDLVKLIGRLKFRTSYGQNILRHSIEVAHIAGMLASELGADVNIAKKGALLHDIGKAVNHEVPGSHAQIGVDIAKKYGISADVIHCIEAHHEDVDAKSVEAIVVKSADAISGARPGARRESLEAYIKRLTELENLANTFPGVEKSYAIQAGREVRIIVKPEEIDDLNALRMAKDIAKKIEEDLQYPGVIKVNVIREVRATEFAK
ncbi:MAG: ribonuclease Y [bacterium]|nr:ribonuclease Y [bacterium]